MAVLAKNKPVMPSLEDILLRSLVGGPPAAWAGDDRPWFSVAGVDGTYARSIPRSGGASFIIRPAPVGFGAILILATDRDHRALSAHATAHPPVMVSAVSAAGAAETADYLLFRRKPARGEDRPAIGPGRGRIWRPLQPGEDEAYRATRAAWMSGGWVEGPRAGRLRRFHRCATIRGELRHILVMERVPGRFAVFVDHMPAVGEDGVSVALFPSAPKAMAFIDHDIPREKG